MGSSQDDLASLDAAVDRIRKAIPSQPYIQTIPQEGSHWDHHHRESSRVWRGQAPFGRDERPDLQYQTFYYHEHGTDLIHLRVHSPPPQLRTDRLDKPGSSANTPKLGPKKKISLADYKSNKSRGLGDTSSKHTPANSTPEPARIDTPEAGHADTSQTWTRDFAETNGTSTLKRKRSSDLSTRTPPPHERHGNGAPGRSPQSPARGDSAATFVSPPSPTVTAQRMEGNEGAGRALFADSPAHNLMPGRLSPLGNLLPERLSPELPPTIVAELDRRARMRNMSDVSGSPPEVARQIEDSERAKQPKQPTDVSKTKREASPPPASSSRPHSDSKVSNKTSSTDTGTSDEEKRPQKSQHVPKLLVKLKIPRRLRSDYRRLLRFKPQPAAKPPKDVDTSAHKASSSGDSANKATSAQKDEGVTTKKPKPGLEISTARKNDSDSKLPKTPLQAPFQSPTVPSRHHALQTPSSKKFTASNISRVSSTEAIGPVSAAGTPVPGNSKPSPSGSVSQTTPESEAWAAEGRRFLELGKTLKSAARQHESRDNVLSLLTNIESLCAFMLSFHANDMECQNKMPPLKHATARRTWVSLHAFWRFVWDRADKYPVLKAAVGGLGLVYLARICTWAASNTKDREKECAEAVAMLGRIGAGTRISVAMAQKTWPETWEKSLAEEAQDEAETGQPGKYAGPLELPVGFYTPTLRAVRTTLVMLDEWRIKEQGKPFQTTLKLI